MSVMITKKCAILRKETTGDTVSGKMFRNGNNCKEGQKKPPGMKLMYHTNGESTNSIQDSSEIDLEGEVNAGGVLHGRETGEVRNEWAHNGFVKQRGSWGKGWNVAEKERIPR
jgi:hypothetical protein